MTDQFYLQDSRSFCGNDIFFWKLGGGYTTDVSKAEVFTKTDAVKMHRSRETDIPWPKEYIDAKTRPAVDHQYVKLADALEGTGIEIIKPKKEISKPMNCHNCGAFVSDRHRYLHDCKKCGADNRQ